MDHEAASRVDYRSEPSGIAGADAARTPALRAAIVDGNLLVRERLRKLCAEDHALEVVGESGEPGAVLPTLDACCPDLLLVAADIGGSDILELVGSIDAGRRPLIIVVSADERRACCAFRIDAVDYLLRPFDRRRFHQAIARARTRATLRSQRSLREEIERIVHDAVRAAVARSAPRAPARLVLERGEERFFVNTCDIESLSVAGDHLQVRVGKEQYRMRGSLRQAENVVDSTIFMRVRRSVVVNTLKIRKAERWFHGEYALTLESGQRVVSGREYRRRLLRCLTNQHHRDG